MLASILISVISAVLFLYWFRCTCLLIISQGNADDALKVAATIQLSFTRVEEALRTNPGATALDALHQSLEADYQILTDLLSQAASANSIERRFLTIDYRVMRILYKVTGTSKALVEMSSILGYFAGEIGAASA